MQIHNCLILLKILVKDEVITKFFSILLLIFLALSFNCCDTPKGTTSDSAAGDTLVSEFQNMVLPTDPDTVIHTISNLEEGLALFKELGYTEENWKKGVREIPRLNLMKIPGRWRSETSRHIEVSLKKSIFFHILAPLALETNENILVDRARLLTLLRNPQSSWKPADRKYIIEIAEKYKVSAPAPQNIKLEFVKQLLEHVDIIPPSLALAQSADESGWGTSRFAAEGNALFGQWSWDENAIKPKQQRAGMGNYGLARFDTPLGSMTAYMHNLNTHNAYQKLRQKRAAIRAEKLKPTGMELVSTLDKYSERGQDYVDDLLSIIRVNHLEQVDSAYLADGPIILLETKN